VVLHSWSDHELSDFPGLQWSEMSATAHNTLVERLAGWQERYREITVQLVVVEDKPARHLVERSKSAQLLVVGSHGRGGFAGMHLGSVSTAVVHAVRVPVIVARQG
jgi:nucleotide-binding universal stress UspA family protein